MNNVYRIYPSIGIARIGNSSQYFIGSESPSLPITGAFKVAGKVKKQGARFRVYEFQVDASGNESIVREVTASSSTRINWQVHLCNRKAASRNIPTEPASRRNAAYQADKLIIEDQQRIAGQQQSSNKLIGRIQFVRNNRLRGQDNVVLGQLKTDAQGRLIVLGGDGVSKSPLNSPLNGFANNDGWYDDCCDGPVTASVTINGATIQAQSAWVVVASPAYAPDIKNITTWYDQAKDVNAKFFNPLLNLRQPSFTDDIYPILKRIVLLQWVSATARAGHGAGRRGNFLSAQMLNNFADNSNTHQAQRQAIFERLVIPGTSAPGPELRPPYPRNMPFLYSGVDPSDRRKYQYASITQHQYLMMEKWAAGDFIADWTGEPAAVALDDIPLEQQPDALTRAALEGCIGGPFFPGIETTYIMVLADTYESAYRIRQTQPAGHMTELMALPWQADFDVCGAFWWPAQRPTSVKRNGNFANFSEGVQGYQNMVNDWHKLGFVVQNGDEYIEQERDPTI